MKSNMKVLGKPKTYFNTDNDRVTVRFRTSFPVKNEGEGFLYKLNTLGFIVESYVKNYISVALPQGWAHIRVTYEKEMIIDEKSRPRIIIDRKTNLTRVICRYGFTVNMMEKDGQINIVSEIVDCGLTIAKYPMTEETLRSVLDDSIEPTKEILLELAKGATVEILFKQYPCWENPLAYWED